jgi:valyl-tRNA synthetase
MSGNAPISTAPLAAAEQPAASSTAPVESADGVSPAPLTKSALKKLEKEKALAAKKALKQANNATKLNTAAPSGEKKEKKEKVKKEEVVEEPPYQDVPEGEKKGESSGSFVGNRRNEEEDLRKKTSYEN